jgi:hypothetical protein
MKTHSVILHLFHVETERSVSTGVHGCKCEEKQSGHMAFIPSSMKIHKLLQNCKTDNGKI